MWDVEKTVDEVENYFVDLMSPQNFAHGTASTITRDPQFFKSIYRCLSGLIAYPRCYDYVGIYI